MSGSKSAASSLFLTIALLSAILLAGVSYQHHYNSKKADYTQRITHFYEKYLGREPDAIGLRHWVRWSMTKWPIDQVEKLGFQNVGLQDGTWTP
jgi:hypothetical protein